VSPPSAAAHAAHPRDDTVDVAAAVAPAAAETRRPRGRISLADVIFKLLCLIIAVFFILLFGVIGGVLYLTS